MRSYVYVYFMADEPEPVRDAAPRHTEYWHSFDLAGYTGGPFADRSGGLITLLAADDEAARGAVDGDPFVRAGLLGQSWLMRWEPAGAAEPFAPELRITSR